MARHHPAGEEMLCDPVLAVGAVEQIGAGAVGEDVHEEAAIGREPGSRPRHQFAPVHHVLEHLDRDDAIEPGGRIEHVHVRGDYAKVLQSTFAGFALDEFALRA